MDIRIITPQNYPPRLKEIPGVPAQLYVRGQNLPNDLAYIAFVGSRKCSPYGREVCNAILRELRDAPVAIVSGLALGIDGYAHKAALDQGLYTVAIPGSGLHPSVLYPANHRQLASQILESGGTLLSEFEPNFKAAPWSFPQRNRIMAGLSHAVIVVEAEMKSGTLITARLALDYNREVCAVPGSIFSPLSDGPHYLIRNGATPIRSGKDILDTLGICIRPEEKIKRPIETLSENEQKVIALLSHPSPRDELLHLLELPVHTANSLLIAMEIKGLIREVGGELYKC